MKPHEKIKKITLPSFSFFYFRQFGGCSSFLFSPVTSLWIFPSFSAPITSIWAAGDKCVRCPSSIWSLKLYAQTQHQGGSPPRSQTPAGSGACQQHLLIAFGVDGDDRMRSNTSNTTWPAEAGAHKGAANITARAPKRMHTPQAPTLSASLWDLFFFNLCLSFIIHCQFNWNYKFSLLV